MNLTVEKTIVPNSIFWQLVPVEMQPTTPSLGLPSGVVVYTLPDKSIQVLQTEVQKGEEFEDACQRVLSTGADFALCQYRQGIHGIVYTVLLYGNDDMLVYDISVKEEKKLQTFMLEEETSYLFPAKRAAEVYLFDKTTDMQSIERDYSVLFTAEEFALIKNDRSLFALLREKGFSTVLRNFEIVQDDEDMGRGQYVMKSSSCVLLLYINRKKKIKGAREELDYLGKMYAYNRCLKRHKHRIIYGIAVTRDLFFYEYTHYMDSIEVL